MNLSLLLSYFDILLREAEEVGDDVGHGFAVVDEGLEDFGGGAGGKDVVVCHGGRDTS